MSNQKQEAAQQSTKSNQLYVPLTEEQQEQISGGMMVKRMRAKKAKKAKRTG